MDTLPDAVSHPAPHYRHAGRYDAVVEANEPICQEHDRLRLRVQGAFPASKPGQFVQLQCRQPRDPFGADGLLGGELEWSPDAMPRAGQPELCGRLALLRRPFSLAGRGEDAAGTWLEVIHRVVGTGTDWLHGLKPGAAVDLIGPLGNAFTLRAGYSRGLLVGGGVGLPPMFYLAELLASAGWEAAAFVGATRRDLLAVTLVEGATVEPVARPQPVVQEFARFGYPTLLSTDDGSLGLPGRITDGLAAVLAELSAPALAETVVFTCGPNAMMRAVAALAERAGVRCQVCVEQAMACGLGTCQSCIVKIEDTERPQGTTPGGRPWRYRLACTDGPVFRSEQVVW